MSETGFRKWIITITVITAAIIELIDTSIVNVALTDMSGNLGATIDDTAWVVTAYAIANGIVIPMTSFLAARFGRRNYYATSIAIFTAASFMCGHATGLWELVIFRFIQGAGGGALLSTSQAILFENFPAEQRGFAAGIFGLGIVVGPTIGPTLGGWIVDNFSWPWIFYVNIPIGIVAFLLVLAFIEEPKHKRDATHIDWPGIGLLIACLGALQVVLERGEAEDWFQTPYITLLAAVAAVSFVLFIWWELRIEHPVVNLRVLKSRPLALAALLTFVLGFGLYASVFIVPIFAQQLLHFTAMQTGLLLLPSSLMAAVMMPWVGKAMTKGFPPQVLVVSGFLIFSFFCYEMSTYNLQAGEANFFWPLILRGLGLSMITVPITAIAVSGLHPRDLPQGTALNNMMRQLGGSFGIALINTYIVHRVAAHRSDLVSRLNPLNPGATARLDSITHALAARGSSLWEAKQQAWQVLDNIVHAQTYLLSYMDSFRVICFFALCCVPLVLLTFVKHRGGPRPLVLSDH